MSVRAVNAAVRRSSPMEGRGKLQAIDRQLELLSAVSASIRRLGGHPDTSLIDELLDERWECQWQLSDVPATVRTDTVLQPFVTPVDPCLWGRRRDSDFL